MRHIHLDLVGGLTEDMFAAAVLDAFPQARDYVRAQVAAAVPAATVALVPAAAEGGSRLLVALPPDAAVPPAGAGTIDARFQAVSGMDDACRAQALAILRRVAGALTGMRGMSASDVSTDDLGGWSAVAGIVAAGAAIAWLGEVRWSCSDLPLGGGPVTGRRGLVPVPAPATLAILAGFVWRQDGVVGERVTPVGAAVLRQVVAPDVATVAPTALGRLVACGVGAGDRGWAGLPDVARALVFADGASSTARDDAEAVAVVSFEVDDMTGADIAIALDRIRTQDGVLDVVFATVTGKKGRPQFAVRLLVRPDRVEDARRWCFLETSTIGVRWHLDQRECLDRSAAVVGIDGRPLRVKRVRRPDGRTTAKTESDDVSTVPGLNERRSLRRRAERISSADADSEPQP